MARKSAVGVALLVALGAVGCTSVQAADKKRAGDAPVTVTAPADKAVPATAATARPSGGTSAKPTGSGTGTGSGSGSGSATTPRKPTTGGTTTTAAGGAKVVSFTVVKQPSCPVMAKPGAPYSSPGAPVVLAWKVTGAPGAALSVDAPSQYGSYGEYDAEGTIELSFPCGTTAGTTKHTYTVWPKGVHTGSKSLTVSATNNT